MDIHCNKWLHEISASKEEDKPTCRACFLQRCVHGKDGMRWIHESDYKTLQLIYKVLNIYDFYASIVIISTLTYKKFAKF